jgi:hypothetical protein
MEEGHPLNFVRLKELTLITGLFLEYQTMGKVQKLNNPNINVMFSDIIFPVVDY